jgi:hypothetical protein
MIYLVFGGWTLVVYASIAGLIYIDNHLWPGCSWSDLFRHLRRPRLPKATVLRLGNTSVKHQPLPKCWHYQCSGSCPICQWARR